MAKARTREIDHQFGGGSANALSVTSLDPAFLENAVFRVDVSDDRRTAESLLSIQAHEIPDVLVELAKSKRLSIVMGNLNEPSPEGSNRPRSWSARYPSSWLSRRLNRVELRRS